jgi:hypothetical protein
MPNCPVDPSEFTTIISKLNKLFSSTNFLSK